MWEGVGDRTKTATYWPPPNSSGYHCLSFPFSWAAQPGAWGIQPLLGHGSHSSIFSLTDLNFLSPGSYNNLSPTYFLRASQMALSSTPRQSRSPLISWYLRPDAPVIYADAFLLLTAWPGSICNTHAHTQMYIYIYIYINSKVVQIFMNCHSNKYAIFLCIKRL